MTGTRALATVMVGILSCAAFFFSLTFAFTREDLRTAKTESERTETALRQEIVDMTIALKAAQYLALDNVGKDYAKRGEPNIRLCVPSHGDPMVARVRHCMTGEHEVVFPISYLGLHRHPGLGEPTVDSRTLHSP